MRDLKLGVFELAWIAMHGKKPENLRRFWTQRECADPADRPCLTVDQRLSACILEEWSIHGDNKLNYTARGGDEIGTGYGPYQPS